MIDTRRPGPPRPPAKHVLTRRCGRYPGRLRVDKPDDYGDASEAFLRVFGDDDGDE